MMKIKSQKDPSLSVKEFQIKQDGKHLLEIKQEFAQLTVDQVIGRIFCGCGHVDAAEDAFREVMAMFDGENFLRGSPKATS